MARIIGLLILCVLVYWLGGMIGKTSWGQNMNIPFERELTEIHDSLERETAPLWSKITGEDNKQATATQKQLPPRAQAPQDRRRRDIYFLPAIPQGSGPIVRSNPQHQSIKTHLYKHSAQQAQINQSQAKMQASTSSNNNNRNKCQAQHVDIPSTPAEPIIGVVPTPVRGLVYELNRVSRLADGNVRLHWKIKNNRCQPIMLSRSIKSKLNGAKIAVVDGLTDRRFTIQYDETQQPIMNCMLVDVLPAYGRVSCSAVVGPVYRSLPGLIGSRVKVYMPNNLRYISVSLAA